MASSEQGTRAPGPGEHPEPAVRVEHAADVVRLTVEGELTDAARRPLVREVTDQLLARHAISRIELDLRGVPFVNSAGLAVLVQVHRLAAPRAIEVVLVAPTAAVTRPLQLSGLWPRFTITGHDGPDDGTHDGTG